MKAFILLLLLSTLFTSSLTKNVEVPAVKVKEELDIRLNSLQVMEQPNFKFDSVYSRSVKQSKNSTLVDFPPCQEQGPEVEFKGIDEKAFLDVPTPPLVIYKFQDIKYSQFLLDIMVEGNKIYVMFQNGRAAIYNLKNRKFDGKGKTMKVQGLTQQRLQLGYFAKAGESIVFMNSKYAIKVENDKAFVLDGYLQTSRFETVISVGSQYIAAAYAEVGIKFFSVSDSTIQVVSTIQKTNFTTYNELELADLAYYEGKDILLALDEDNGVSSFSLTYDSSGITISKMSYILKKQLCDLMYLYEDNLYVVCDDVVKVNLAKLPKTQETPLAHPNIKVRQIYANGNILAFIGRNVFKLMYMERLVDYYEDQRMDKLVFTSDLYISANEDGIYVGNYTIIEPYISCKTSNEKYLGTHHLVFKTKAKCDEKYIQKYNIDKSKLGEIDENDMCIYTAYRNVYIWQVGEIFMLPILIAIIVFLFLAFIIAIVYLVKKAKLKNLMNELSQYEKLVPSQQGKHSQLVEEDPHKSNASNKQDDEPVEEQPNVDEKLHDIE